MIFAFEVDTRIMFSSSQPCELTVSAAALFLTGHCASARPEDKNITTMNWDAQNSRNSLWKSAQKEKRTWRRVAGFLARGMPGGGRAPLWAEQFAEGQRMIASELADITGLIKKTKGPLHWHTRASPLWRRVRFWLKELAVWVDSSLSLTWPPVEDVRPIKKHACAH